MFSTNVNLLYLLYSRDKRYCLLHLRKQNCLLKTSVRTLILMTQVSLYPFFLLELILKLHNICITSTIVKNVITKLESSKASGPGCIPVVVLKNFEPELSYILAELFNIYQKDSCFPDCWKVSSVVPVSKSIG